MPPNGERTPLIAGRAPLTPPIETHEHRGFGWASDDPRPWVKYPMHVANVTWLTLTSNYVNILLVFVPLGIISGALGWNPNAVFCLNFLAIVPLASLLSFATEEANQGHGKFLKINFFFSMKNEEDRFDKNVNSSSC